MRKKAAPMNSEMLSYFLHSGICLAIFYSLYWLFLRKEKTFRFNRYYLLASVILSYIMPLINFSGLFSREIAAALPGTMVKNFVVPEKTIQFATESSVLAQQTQFNPLDYLQHVYLIIAAVLTLKLLLGITRLYLIWKRGSRDKTGDYIIVYTKDNIAPFSFFRYIFLNEENINRNAISEIIAHEIIHINQNHSVDIILVNIAAIMQWFNPFIWLVKRALKETHEFSADEKVIAQGFDSAAYSELLINQIAGAKAMDFAKCFNHLLIKKRLIMLKKLRPGRLASLKKILILPLALLLAVSFNIQGQEVKEKIFEKKAPKPHRTETQKEAMRDSIMSLKSPTFNDKISQALIIAQREIILPKDIDSKKYFYSVGVHFDTTGKRIEIEANRHLLDVNGKPIKGSKMENVKIINYDELISKLPRVPWEDFVKGKIYTGFSGSALIIDKLQKHFEYWKTHKQ
jgi:hypothetical protein